MRKWFLILALPVILSAQAGRGPRPWFLDSQVVHDLNISDVQIKQIRQTQKDFHSRLSELRAEVNKAENDLDAAFNDDPVDQVKSNDAINRLASARGELTRAVSQMDLKLRTVLTAQQWQELKKRERTLPGMRRHVPATSAPPTPTVPNQK
jgi:Spy/CpxP family protein refolding chaperone